MIQPTDQTVELTPSHHGENCLGNGEHPGIECQCDECPHYLTCFPEWEEFVNRPKEVLMNELTIKAPAAFDCDQKEWPAKYRVIGTAPLKMLQIESRSSIDVIVAQVQDDFYISSPNFGVAIPSINNLDDSFWITEKLIHAGMPTPDAVTVAQVLRALGNF